MIKQAPKLRKSQLKKLKTKILEEKERLLLSQTKNLEKLGLELNGHSDEVDQANADYSNAQMLRFRNREVFYSKKLDKALEKMDLEEYGECSDCGANIRFERLWARPTADMCINCKEESERDESHNFIARQSKSLGRSISVSSRA